MIFVLTLLRERGKRQSTATLAHDDALIESNQDGKFLSLSARSCYGGQSNAPNLFEARLMKFSPQEIVFLGFEQVDGRAYVQEWKLTPATFSTRTNHGGSQAPEIHHLNRLSAS